MDHVGTSSLISSATLRRVALIGITSFVLGAGAAYAQPQTCPSDQTLASDLTSGKLSTWESSARGVGDATLNSVSVTVDYKEGDVVECRYAPKNSALSSQPIVLTSKSPTVEPLEGLGKWEQTKNVFTCTPSASDSCQFKTYSANVSVNAETESTFCDDLGKQLQAEEANLKELKRLFDAGEISMIEYTMARTSILARIDQIRAIGKMEGCF